MKKLVLACAVSLFVFAACTNKNQAPVEETATQTEMVQECCDHQKDSCQKACADTCTAKKECKKEGEKCCDKKAECTKK